MTMAQIKDNIMLMGRKESQLANNNQWIQYRIQNAKSSTISTKFQAVIAVLGVLTSLVGIMLIISILLIEVGHERLEIDTICFLISGTLLFHVIQPLNAAYFLVKVVPIGWWCGNPYSPTQSTASFSAEHAVEISTPRLVDPDLMEIKKLDAKKYEKYSKRWLFIFILIIISGAGLTPMISDVVLAYQEINNSTLKNETLWWRARAAFRLSAYMLEIPLFGLALANLLYIYFYIRKQSFYMTQLFLTGNVDFGIRQLRRWAENTSRLVKYIPVEKRSPLSPRDQISYAHRFSSSYIIINVLFFVSYAWFVCTTDGKITWDFIWKCGGHLCGYVLLAIYMWRTNIIVDKMKKIILLSVNLKSYNDAETNNTVINKQIYEHLKISLLMNQHQPYAFFFSQKLSLIGLMITILPGILGQVYPLIDERLHLSNMANLFGNSMRHSI